MNFFACFTLDLTGLLIVLGIALVIAMAATYLIAIMMSLIFRAPVQTMLGAEAIALLICAGVVRALVNGFEEIVVLTLLGTAACVVILVMNWLFAQIMGRSGMKDGNELCALGLSEQPNFGAAE